jgi:hypothetical protein
MIEDIFHFCLKKNLFGDHKDDNAKTVTSVEFQLTFRLVAMFRV